MYESGNRTIIEYTKIDFVTWTATVEEQCIVDAVHHRQ